MILLELYQGGLWPVLVPFHFGGDVLLVHALQFVLGHELAVEAD